MSGAATSITMGKRARAATLVMERIQNAAHTWRTTCQTGCRQGIRHGSLRSRGHAPQLQRLPPPPGQGGGRSGSSSFSYSHDLCNRHEHEDSDSGDDVLVLNEQLSARRCQESFCGVVVIPPFLCCCVRFVLYDSSPTRLSCLAVYAAAWRGLWFILLVMHCSSPLFSQHPQYCP